MKTLLDWYAHHKPDSVAWVVLRVNHCRVNYFSVGTEPWTENLEAAFPFASRDEAFSVAREQNGLIVIINRLPLALHGLSSLSAT